VVSLLSAARRKADPVRTATRMVKVLANVSRPARRSDTDRPTSGPAAATLLLVMEGAKRGKSRSAPKEGREVDAEIVDSEGRDAPLASVASGSGRVLTRVEVARRLGLSPSTIRRMEGKVLNPVVGARGVHYFTETEIEAVFVRIRESRRGEGVRAEGRSGAEAFALFREGGDPIEAVKRLELGPDAAERLFRQWQRFGETMVIERAAVAQLEAALAESTPIGDDQALVLAIARLKRSSAAHCVLCHRSHARLCRECAREAAEAALAEEDARKLV
jgi:hypothetical protein